MYHDKALEMHQ